MLLKRVSSYYLGLSGSHTNSYAQSLEELEALEAEAEVRLRT